MRNKVILYNSGNYSVINHNGKEYEKMCVCDCVCVCACVCVYVCVYELNHFDIYQKLTHIVDQV